MGMFATNLNANEAIVQNIIPAAGTVKNFFALVETAPQAGRSWTFTVRKNGADTAVTCTIVGDGVLRTCSDTVNTAAFVSGDLIAIRITRIAARPGQHPRAVDRAVRALAPVPQLPAHRRAAVAAATGSAGTNRRVACASSHPRGESSIRS